jgi:ABC-type sugar transport system ATPase subunit
MSYISLKNLSISFGVVQALKNVTFDIEKGDVIALCGENGAGKSTLAKILAGVYTYPMYTGKFFFKGKEIKFRNTKEGEAAGIGIVHQELNQFNNMTVAENIFMGSMPNNNGVIDKRTMYREAQKLVDEFKIGVHSAQLMNELSISQCQLIEIIKAVTRNCEVIIFDEATSSLTEAEVRFLFSLINDLKKQKITIIYVSHKLAEIFEICDKVVVLKDGEYINSAKIKDVDNDTIVNWMIGRKLEQMFPPYKHTEEERPNILEVNNWHVHKKGKEIIKNVNFHLKKGEILGFYGLVGAGRTELMESIFCGKGSQLKGQLFLNGKEVNIKSPVEAIQNRVAMLTEDRKLTGLILTANVRENIALASLNKYSTKFKFIQKRQLKKAILNIVAKLKIKVPDIEYPITKLSGGNQQKVVISKWLLSEPEILILDEPTRGIDVGTKSEIYFMLRKLANEGVSIIFISGEMTELMGTCDRVYVMKEGQIVDMFIHDEFNEENFIKAAL